MTPGKINDVKSSDKINDLMLPGKINDVKSSDKTINLNVEVVR